MHTYMAKQYKYLDFNGLETLVRQIKDYIITNNYNPNAPINSSVLTNKYLAGNSGTTIINSTAKAGAFVMLDKLNSTNGVFMDGVYGKKRSFYYTSNNTIAGGEQKADFELTILDESGNSSFPGSIAVSKSGSYTAGNKNVVTGGALYSLLETKNWNANHLTWFNPGAYINNGVWPAVKSDIPSMRANKWAFLQDSEITCYVDNGAGWELDNSGTFILEDGVFNGNGYNSGWDWPNKFKLVITRPVHSLRYLYINAGTGGSSTKLQIWVKNNSSSQETLFLEAPLKTGPNMYECWGLGSAYSISLVFQMTPDEDGNGWYSISDIGAYGSSSYNPTRTYMANYDHLYDWDNNQNMILPAGICMGDSQSPQIVSDDDGTIRINGYSLVDIAQSSGSGVAITIEEVNTMWNS